MLHVHYPNMLLAMLFLLYHEFGFFTGKGLLGPYTYIHTQNVNLDAIILSLSLQTDEGIMIWRCTYFTQEDMGPSRAVMSLLACEISQVFPS